MLHTRQLPQLHALGTVAACAAGTHQAVLPVGDGGSQGQLREAHLRHPDQQGVQLPLLCLRCWDPGCPRQQTDCCRPPGCPGQRKDCSCPCQQKEGYCACQQQEGCCAYQQKEGYCLPGGAVHSWYLQRARPPSSPATRCAFCCRWCLPRQALVPGLHCMQCSKYGSLPANFRSAFTQPQMPDGSSSLSPCRKLQPAHCQARTMTAHSPADIEP